VNHGGRAFPNPKGSYGLPNDGMSLRDYFAAAAMQGFLANRKCVEGIETDYAPEVVCSAVSYADALIDELSKEPKETL
jgi:hypothetical protein